MFRAPQWHGATQTHFPPRLRKSAWHCDITDVIRHTVCPHTGSNPITRYRQSSRSPATRRVSTSMFRAPQWHGATQTHFPPRPRKSAWHLDITDVIPPHGLITHYKQSYHTIPPIIPLTSDTPRLHQHVSRSPVARRRANALTTKAAQIRMALRHQGRNFATRSDHALQAILSHNTTNHPAHQRHAAFTPACFALPSGTAPRKHTFHQGHVNPHGTATSDGRNFDTRSAHTLQAIISHDTANHPHAHQRHAAFTPACFALPSGTAPRKRTSHQDLANPHGTATSRT